MNEAPAVARPELGTKRVCPTTGRKFYDLNRRPAVCPKCGEQFDPEEALKSRRVRARWPTRLAGRTQAQRLAHAIGPGSRSPL